MLYNSSLNCDPVRRKENQPSTSTDRIEIDMSFIIHNHNHRPWRDCLISPSFCRRRWNETETCGVQHATSSENAKNLIRYTHIHTMSNFFHDAA